MASDLSSCCNEMFDDEKEEGEISLEDVSSSEEMPIPNRYSPRTFGQCPYCMAMGSCATWCRSLTFNKNYKQDVAGKENRHYTRYRRKDGAPPDTINISAPINHNDLQPISSDEDDLSLELLLLKKKLFEKKSKLRKLSKKKRKRSPSLSLSPPPPSTDLEVSLKESIHRKDNSTTIFSKEKHRSGHRHLPDRKRSPARRHTKRRSRSRSPRKKSPVRPKKVPKRLSPVPVAEPTKLDHLEESPSSRGTVTKLLKKVRKLEPFSTRTKEQGSSLKDKLSNIIKSQNKAGIIEEKEKSINNICDENKSELAQEKSKQKQVVSETSCSGAKSTEKENNQANEVVVTKFLPNECEIVKQVINIPEETVSENEEQGQNIESTEKKEKSIEKENVISSKSKNLVAKEKEDTKREAGEVVKVQPVQAVETIETIESIEPVEESSAQKLSAFHMDDNDEDLELRMIALRSAVIKKHHSRVKGGLFKKKQKAGGTLPRIESPFTSNFVEEFPLLAEICNEDSLKKDDDLYDIEDMELDSDMENDDDRPYSPSDDIGQFLLDNEELQEHEQSLYTPSKPTETPLKEGAAFNNELDGSIFESRAYSPSDDTIYDPDLPGMLSSKPATAPTSVITNAPALQPPPMPPLAMFNPQSMLVPNIFNPFNSFSILNPLAAPFFPFSAPTTVPPPDTSGINQLNPTVNIAPVPPPITIHNVNQFDDHKIGTISSINQMNRSPLPIVNNISQMDVSPVASIESLDQLSTSSPGNISINQANISVSTNLNNNSQLNSPTSAVEAISQSSSSTENNINRMNISNESTDDLGDTDLDGSPLVPMDQPQTRSWPELNGEPLYLRDLPDVNRPQENKMPQFLEPTFVPLSVLKHNKHLRKLVPQNNNTRNEMFKSAEMIPVQVEEIKTAPTLKPIRFSATPHRNFAQPSVVFNASIDKVIETIKNDRKSQQEKKRGRREETPVRKYKRSVTPSLRQSRRKSVTPMRIIRKDGERRYELRSRTLKERNVRETERRKSIESRRSPKDEPRRDEQPEEKKRRISVDSNVDDDEQVLREKLLASLAKRNKLIKVPNKTNPNTITTSATEKKDLDIEKIGIERREKEEDTIDAEITTASKDVSLENTSKNLTSMSLPSEVDSTIVVTIERLEEPSDSLSPGHQPPRKVARKLNIIPASTKVVNNAKRFQNLLLQRRLNQQKVALLNSKSRFKINNNKMDKNTHSRSASPQVNDSQRFIIRLNEDSETESEFDEPKKKANLKAELPIPTVHFEKSVEDFLKNMRQKHETTTPVTACASSQINATKASVSTSGIASPAIGFPENSTIAKTSTVIGSVGPAEPIIVTQLSSIDSVEASLPMTPDTSSQIDLNKNVIASTEIAGTETVISSTASTDVSSKETVLTAATIDPTRTVELMTTTPSTEVISITAVTTAITTSIASSITTAASVTLTETPSTTSMTSSNTSTAKTVTTGGLISKLTAAATNITTVNKTVTTTTSISMTKEKAVISPQKTAPSEDPLFSLAATPQAVKHLPASQQEEYRRLKQQLIERERLRLQRLKDATAVAQNKATALVNTVNSASSPISSPIVSSPAPAVTVPLNIPSVTTAPLAKVQEAKTLSITTSPSAPESNTQLVPTMSPISKSTSDETSKSTTVATPTNIIHSTVGLENSVPTNKTTAVTSSTTTAVMSIVTSTPKTVASSIPKTPATSSSTTVTPRSKTIATPTMIPAKTIVAATVTPTSTTSTVSSTSKMSANHAALLDKMNAALLSQRAQINSVAQKVSTLRILTNDQVTQKTSRAQAPALRVLTKDQINQKTQRVQQSSLKVLTKDQINKKTLQSQASSITILTKDQINKKLQAKEQGVDTGANKMNKQSPASASRNNKKARVTTEPKADAAKQPWEDFRQTVIDEVETLTNLSTEEQKKILTEAEEKLIVKRHSVLDDITEMSGSLRQWEIERDIQTLLTIEIRKLREQLRIAEEKLTGQKEKLQTIQPKVQCYHEKINTGRKECFRLSKICNSLGQQIIGVNYTVPTAGAELLNNRIKEVANHTQKLRGKKIQSGLNSIAKIDKTKTITKMNNNTNKTLRRVNKNSASGDKRTDALTPETVNSKSRVSSVKSGANVENCDTNSNVNVSSLIEENQLNVTDARSSNVSMDVVNCETEIPLAESTLKSESNVHIKIENSSSYDSISNSVSNTNRSTFNVENNLLHSRDVILKLEIPDKDSAINLSASSMNDSVNENHGVQDATNTIESESEKQSEQRRTKTIHLGDEIIVANSSIVTDNASLIMDTGNENTEQETISVEYDTENSSAQNAESTQKINEISKVNAESNITSESSESSRGVEIANKQTNGSEEKSSENENSHKNTQKSSVVNLKSNEIQQSSEISQEAIENTAERNSTNARFGICTEPKSSPHNTASSKENDLNTKCVEMAEKITSVNTESNVGAENSILSVESNVNVELIITENTESNNIEYMEDEVSEKIQEPNTSEPQNQPMEVDEQSTDPDTSKNKNNCSANELVNSVRNEDMNIDHEASIEAEYSEMADSSGEHSTLLEEIDLLELANQTEVPDRICYQNLNNTEELPTPQAEKEAEKKKSSPQEFKISKSRLRPYESALKHLQAPRNNKTDGILCPYELMGTCHDADCQFVHLSTSQ